MRRQAWWWVLPGVASLGVALAVLLWPMHEDGVGGNALRPHYGDFGWFSYSDTLSTSDGLLISSVEPMPQERVSDRRHAAEGFGVLGALLLGAAVVSVRRGRPAGPADPT